MTTSDRPATERERAEQIAKAVEAREVEIGNDLHAWFLSQYPDFDDDTSGEDSADIVDHLKMLFRRALSSLPPVRAEEPTDLQQMEARKDAAYLERNQVVAALAKCFRSGVARTAIEGWSDDWHGCVYIDLPTGQVSWHFHDSQAHLFAGLPAYTKPWDGHDTPEKYRRLADLPLAPPQATEGAGDQMDLAKELSNFGHRLALAQKDLPAEAMRALRENLWSLYVSTEEAEDAAALPPVRAQEPTEDDETAARIDAQVSELVRLVGALQRHAKEADWEDVDEPLAAVLGWPADAEDIEPTLAALPPVQEPPKPSLKPLPDHDNHHNALLCPYCNPEGLVLVKPASSPSQGVRLDDLKALENACRMAFDVLQNADQLIGGHSGDEESGRCDEDCFACHFEEALAALSAALEGAATK